MPQGSPAVERAAAVLNFIAENPEHPVAISDLVRALRISRSTCHGLVASLVRVGYLHRTSDKTYVLGPGLALVGQAAARHASPVLIAQPEMRALADEFDVICSAFFREGDHLVVRERAASGAHLGWSSPRGARVRMRAPFAGIFYAWSPPARAEAWLASSTPGATPEERALMSRAMAFARDHGFTVSVRTQPFAGGDERLEQALERGEGGLPISVLGELEPEREYAALSVISPVFDAARDVAFLLALVGFTRRLSGREIERIGARLRGACDHISGFMGGARPS